MEFVFLGDCASQKKGDEITVLWAPFIFVGLWLLIDLVIQFRIHFNKLNVKIFHAINMYILNGLSYYFQHLIGLKNKYLRAKSLLN
jgi:hypothetical protein